jgi:WD40 repeat protein
VRIWTLTGHQGRVRRVAFSPSADRLASAGHDGTARVWDLKTGGGCRLVVAADGAPCSPDGGRTCPNVHHALFAPDGRWLLTTSSHLAEPVRFWDPQTCAPLDAAPRWGEGGSGVQAAAVSEGLNGATLVATGDDDGGVRVMRRDGTGSWAPVCAAQWHTDVVTDAAFSPDGRWLATSSEDGSAALVALTDGGCASPRYLEPQAGILYSVAFAPDSQALVTASLDAKAQVWALDGSLLADLVGHKDRIYAAKFSPDGRWILTASRDGAVRIWMRPTRGSPLPEGSFLTLDGDLGGVAYADFSPDGHSIGAAYWENATLLWRLWTEEVVPDRRLEATWGRDRARLALIREAARFKAENRLDRRERDISDAAPRIE